MCCRLRLDNRVLLKRGGGLFGANPLTGSIGVVTINLPRIGYQADSVDDFMKRLKKLVHIAKESLTIKRKVLEFFTDKNLYPLFEILLKTDQRGHWALLEKPFFNHRNHRHERGVPELVWAGHRK